LLKSCGNSNFDFDEEDKDYMNEKNQGLFKWAKRIEEEGCLKQLYTMSAFAEDMVAVEDIRPLSHCSCLYYVKIYICISN